MLQQGASAADIRSALMVSANNDDGKPLKKLTATVKDTAVYAVSEVLSEKTLFDTSTKHISYKDRAFPSNSQKYIIYGMSAMPSIAFTAASDEIHASYYQHFLEESYIEIRIEGDENTKIYLKDLVPSIVVNTPSTDAATLPHLARKDKENNVFPFPDPIEIGAGENIDITFVPATGLTTAAASATVGNFLPNLELANDLGHAVRFYLHAFKLKSAKR